MSNSIIRNIIYSDIFGLKLNDLIDDFIKFKFIKLNENYKFDYIKVYNNVKRDIPYISRFFRQHYEIQQQKKDSIKYVNLTLCFFCDLKNCGFHLLDYKKFHKSYYVKNCFNDFKSFM